jgi:TP901 family phage tail tape measure protein
VASVIGRLVAIIDGDLTGLEKALGDAQRQLGRAGRAFTDAGKALTIGITAPIVAVGALATKASIDFESAFAGVRKTVDASESQFADLRKGILDMSKVMPASAKEIAGVAEAAGQLGVKAEDVLDFTKTMVMLGETTNLTAEQAAVGFARIANVMQIPQENIGRLGAALVELGNKSAATESEILEMATRLAGAGQTIGLSAQDVLSFAAALASVGIEAEAGGSAFSRVMIEMANAVANLQPGPEQIKALADAQGDVEDASYGVESAQRAVRNSGEALRDAYRSLADAQRDQRQASLDSRRETLSVAEAQQGLREVLARSGSDTLDLRAAQLALAEAQNRVREAGKKGGLDLKQAQLGVAQAQQRLNEVMARGGRQSLDLQNAQLRLEEAQNRVGNAARTQAQRIEGAERQVRNAKEGVVESIRGQEKAYGRLGEAQEKFSSLTEQAFGKLGNFAKVAGMLPEEFAALFETDPAEAIVRFVEGLGRIQSEGGNVFKTLDQLGLGEIRVRDALLRAANAGDLFRQSLETGRGAFEKNTALTEEYAKRVGTTAAQLEIMRNRVNVNMILLGDQLTPVLLQVTAAMGPLVMFVGDLIAAFSVLPGPLQLGILGIVGFAATIGPALLVIGQMAQGLRALMGLGAGMRALGLTMMALRPIIISLGAAFLTPPLGIVIALAAVGIALYIFRDDIRKALTAAADTVVNFGKKAYQFLKGPFEDALAWFKGHWPEVATIIAGPFAPLVALATDGFGIRSALIGGMTDVVNWLKGLGGRVIAAVGNAAKWLYNAGLAALQGLWNGMRDKWKDVAGWLAGIGKKIADLKGPIDEDRRLLVPAGVALMEGLSHGMVAGFSRSVVPAIARMENQIAASVAGWRRTADGGWYNPNVTSVNSYQRTPPRYVNSYQRTMPRLASMPHLAGGLPFVTQAKMPALLHYGERVLTADENRAYSAGGGLQQNFNAPITVHNDHRSFDTKRVLAEVAYVSAYEYKSRGGRA